MWEERACIWQEARLAGRICADGKIESLEEKDRRWRFKRMNHDRRRLNQRGGDDVDEKNVTLSLFLVVEIEISSPDIESGASKPIRCTCLRT